MNVEEIVKISSKLESDWLERNGVIETWYTIRELTASDTKTKYETIVSNDPKTFFNLALHFLSARKPTHRIPMTTQSLEEQDRISKAERALDSIWRERDEEQIERGRDPWQRELADFMLIQGWYAVFYAVLEGIREGGKPLPRFVAEIWNPLEVFPRWDGEGMSHCAHIYKTTLGEVRAKAELRGWTQLNLDGEDTKSVKVTDFWRRVFKGGKSHVYNAVLVDKEEVKKEKEEPQFTRIPILTGPVGGSADRGGRLTGQYRTKMGESILEPNRELGKKINDYMSFHADLIRQFAEPPILTTAAGGRTILTPDMLDEEGSPIISGQPEDTAIWMRPPGLPDASGLIVSQLTGMRQRGAFPDSLYGNIGFELSGFAITQLITAALAILTPHKNLMSTIYSQIGKAWLEGYKEGNFGDIIVASLTNRGFYQEDFTSKDVPDCRYIICNVELATPEDMMRRIAIARQAKPQGDILDSVTIIDEVLGLQDAALIQERIGDDMLRAHPAYQQIQLILAMKKKIPQLQLKGRTEEAAILQQAMEQIMANLGAPAPGSPSPASPGMSPENLPAEAQGLSPDALKAMLGRPPPQGQRRAGPIPRAAQRRPQTTPQGALSAGLGRMGLR